MTVDVELLKRALATLERADTSEGVCCCGSSLTQGGCCDNHTPVDAGDYYALSVMDDLRAAIAQENAA